MPNSYAEDMAQVFAPFGDEDWRLCVWDDLGRISAEDAVRQFRQAASILSGFMEVGTEVSLPLYVVLSSAHTLAREARETAEGYVRCAPA